MEEAKHNKINEEKWDKWANEINEKGWRYDYLRRAQENVISLLDIKENIYLLDIGCGSGWALGQAAKLINGKGNFYGVDLSEKMIEKAKENFRGKENFHFIKSNAESIPLEDNFFDIIICNNSFHHYYHPEKALGEMRRLLKPDGCVYILDPTADFWFIKIVEKLSNIFDPAHVKLYSSEEFKNMFLAAGLKYIESKVIKKHQKVHIGMK